jgi:hypothetical protein
MVKLEKVIIPVEMIWYALIREKITKIQRNRRYAKRKK